MNKKALSSEIKSASASKSPSPNSSSIPELSPEQAMLKGDMPMPKPTPMYTNFPLPFPLGIHPAFHPAAYLNYADAIHKGEIPQSPPRTTEIFQTLITFRKTELST